MIKDFPTPTQEIWNPSSSDVITWMSNWKKLSYTTQNLSPHFTQSGKLINSVLFDLPMVESLLSAEGVKTIKARFCICGCTFNVILYSVDGLGARNSCYYLGTPYTWPPIIGGESGNIPEWLAEKWINNWRRLSPSSSFTAGELFDTRYGFLEGYNFDMQDVLKTLYAQKPVNANEYLCLHFALHCHATGEPVSTLKQTFNIVLQRVLSTELGDGVKQTDVISNDVFYDLSAPSPPY